MYKCLTSSLSSSILGNRIVKAGLYFIKKVIEYRIVKKENGIDNENLNLVFTKENGIYTFPHHLLISLLHNFLVNHKIYNLLFLTLYEQQGKWFLGTTKTINGVRKVYICDTLLVALFHLEYKYVLYRFFTSKE